MPGAARWSAVRRVAREADGEKRSSERGRAPQGCRGGRRLGCLHNPPRRVASDWLSKETAAMRRGTQLRAHTAPRPKREP